MKLHLLKSVKYRREHYSPGQVLEITDPEIAQRLLDTGAACKPGDVPKPGAAGTGADTSALEKRLKDTRAELKEAQKKASDLETVNEALRAELAKLQAAAEKGASDAQ